MPSSSATPLNGPGIGLAQPAIDLVRLHARPQRRAPAAGKIRLIDVARADVFERALDGLQILARIVLGDRRLRPAARARPASARRVADRRRCAESGRPRRPRRRSSSDRCRARGRPPRECESPARSDRPPVAASASAARSGQRARNPDRASQPPVNGTLAGRVAATPARARAATSDRAPAGSAPTRPMPRGCPAGCANRMSKRPSGSPAAALSKSAGYRSGEAAWRASSAAGSTSTGSRMRATINPRIQGAEDQRAVRAAEPERVRQRDADRHAPRRRSARSRGRSPRRDCRD